MRIKSGSSWRVPCFGCRYLKLFLRFRYCDVCAKSRLSSPISGSRLKCRVHSLTHLHAYRLVSHFITLWFNRIYLIERLASHFHSHSWSKAWARNSSSIYSHHRLAREWRKIYCNWMAEGQRNDTAKISWRDRSRNRRNKVEVGWLSKKRFVSKHQLSFFKEGIELLYDYRATTAE